MCLQNLDDLMIRLGRPPLEQVHSKGYLSDELPQRMEFGTRLPAPPRRVFGAKVLLLEKLLPPGMRAELLPYVTECFLGVLHDGLFEGGLHARYWVLGGPAMFYRLRRRWARFIVAGGWLDLSRISSTFKRLEKLRPPRGRHRVMRLYW